MVLLSGNKTKTKSKPTVNPNANGPNGRVATPKTAQTNGAAVTKSAASAAIVEAVCSHSNGAPSLHAKDRNEFVREVPTPIYVRFFSRFFTSTSFRSHFSLFCS